MNKALAVLLMTPILSAATASAAITQTTRVLKDTTTDIALKLTPETVFCSDIGYGNVLLKVSVPDLDWLAHFDHRAESEGVPCMASARCTDSFSPARLIDPSNPVGMAKVRVTLTEMLTINSDLRICRRELREFIKGDVKGVAFTHERADEVPVDFDVCEKLTEGAPEQL
jgi:hypothetical protein